MFRILTLFLLLTSSAFSKEVLISFDGSADLGMWQDTLDFAKEHDVKFTYFISAPYFVTDKQEQSRPYWGTKEVGVAPIKFRKAGWATDYKIKRRYDYLHQADREGHEIASHLCGHYEDTIAEKFTYDQWVKEFTFFKETFANDYKGTTITGIRAPCLAVNEAYYRVLKEFGFEYDSSVVALRSGKLSKRYESYNFKTIIPIRQIDVVEPSDGPFKRDMPLSEKKYIQLPFDYNFDVWAQLRKDSIYKNAQYMETVFLWSLLKDYKENPEPTLICLHFEKFEGQPYYNAMKRFVQIIKDQNPSYLTYREYNDRLKRIARANTTASTN